jgi:hypothetical protein
MDDPARFLSKIHNSYESSNGILREENNVSERSTASNIASSSPASRSPSTGELYHSSARLTTSCSSALSKGFGRYMLSP